ncbi:hypothetical protein BDW59DRAFT_164496 [Aspergillus cavernicola]|uniref:Ankyrin repeat-containing domain protein n=1 Tax=Aspergillus cavernicola TaxID=176166 RepID=A0ABR4HZK1_9EURO
MDSLNLSPSEAMSSTDDDRTISDNNSVDSPDVDSPNAEMSYSDLLFSPGMMNIINAIDTAAMDTTAIDATPMSAPNPDGTINPALLTIDPAAATIMGKCRPIIETMGQKLWNAIFANNINALMYLMNNGAKPMSPIPGGSTALDMAIRMGHVSIVRLFHLLPVTVAEIGLRSLLTAITEDQSEIVQVVMEMGMREEMASSEAMKAIVFGWACKYGTPSMLDTLCDYVPSFNWKAYRLWCLNAADESRNRETDRKIGELVRSYVVKEDANGTVDTSECVIATKRVAPLFTIMYNFTLANPEVPIKELLWDEFVTPAPQNPFKYDPEYDLGLGLF